MTTFEAFVSISLTLLKANGRWSTDGVDVVLARDIRATVHDVSRLFRADTAQLEEMVVRELESQAGGTK